MTPRNLDRNRVEANLLQMEELLVDLDDLVGEPSADDLRDDRARRHIAERVLTQLVDLAAAINAHIGSAVRARAPRDYRDSFTLAAKSGAISTELATALHGSAGLRNVLIHGYLDIDLDQVAAAIPLARRFYREYTEAVGAFIVAQPPPDDPDAR